MGSQKEFIAIMNAVLAYEVTGSDTGPVVAYHSLFLHSSDSSRYTRGTRYTVPLFYVRTIQN